MYKELKKDYPEDDLNIDYEKITSSPYLEAFIKEVLRMHLPIAKIFRKALVDSELNYNGKSIEIPKETLIAIPIYALHRYEKYFPEPNKFKPERFLNNEPLPFTYLPFGDGPRNCVAMRLGKCLRFYLYHFI